MIHIESLSSEVISAPCPHCLFSRDTLCLPHALKQLLASPNATSRFSNNYTTHGSNTLCLLDSSSSTSSIPDSIHFPYIFMTTTLAGSMNHILPASALKAAFRLSLTLPRSWRILWNKSRHPKTGQFVNWMIRNIYHLQSRWPWWRPMYWFVITPYKSPPFGRSCEAVPATSTALAKATPTARPVSFDVAMWSKVMLSVFLLHLSSDNLCFFATNTTNQPIIFQELLLSGSNRCSIRTPPTC